MSKQASPTASGSDDDNVATGPKGYPPFPLYTKPAPPSVAETVAAGHGLRQTHKVKQGKNVRPLPKPAKPRSPKATDVKLSYQAMMAHARCLRRHGGGLTDRLERMAKPRRRNIIYLWRDNKNTLTADTIARLRSMLNADEPFKPDQAYAYFVNLKRSKKKAGARKKDFLGICHNKKYVWARHATVAFAQGIQMRLGRPGRYSLADGMLRLSDNILRDISGVMKMRTPSRYSKSSKAKFMAEIADKIAVWIDEILSESDDRMLMMDVDEDDEEVEMFYASEEKKAGKGGKAGSPKSGSPKSGSPKSGSPPQAATPAGTPRTTPSTPSKATPGSTPGTKSPASSPPTTGNQTPKSTTSGKSSPPKSR